MPPYSYSVSAFSFEARVEPLDPKRFKRVEVNALHQSGIIQTR